MYWKIRSIRSKLLLSFLLFVIATCGIVLLNIWLNSRREEVTRINAQLNQINLEIQRIKRVEGDFLKDEVINPNFYNTQESRYLNQHNKSLASIREGLQEIQEHPEVSRPFIVRKIEYVRAKLTSYQHTFHELQDLIIKRGFKDFGLEGKMRDYAHKIEQITLQYDLSMAKLLAIRRIEKDFMLRKEWHYTQDIIPVIEAFRAEINEKITDFEPRKRILELLGYYQSTFRQIAYADRSIGFSNEAGIRNQLTQDSNEIESEMTKLNTEIVDITQNLNTQTISTFIAIIAIAVILLIFFALFLTQALSRPIRSLSQSIHQVIEHNFSQRVTFEPLNTRDEIGKLSKDFGLMLQTVQNSIEKIQTQSEKIERKQFALMESLRYAQTIQQAILPDVDDFSAFFQDFFVLYKPMHTVSGDFYWLAEQRDLVFLAVVDCTGHGVPGAFMSMVGNALLGKIVNEQEIFNPALVLALLDAEVKQSLRQERDKNNDGMDISICKFEGLATHQDTVQVTFSGAKGKVFYTRERELIKERSTRRSIGGKSEGTKHDTDIFENIEFTLKRGDTLYMATDGYCDQPNERRKKIGTKQFMDVLQTYIEKPLAMQCEALQNALVEHMVSPLEQRDDITVVGVRI